MPTFVFPALKVEGPVTLTALPAPDHFAARTVRHFRRRPIHISHSLVRRAQGPDDYFPGDVEAEVRYRTSNAAICHLIPQIHVILSTLISQYIQR
ncbi:hypothetical protein CVT26_003688 [Gymnopilus dilepis]|uniref:Uncharacterized protein n=1 Tax=Gymnopilus dilepis TaxID=231916 RepID=A0A409WU96_9AGAR|nr:hypothetical protein CVT26_003688 [Gymnopilus dilepis]